MKLLSSNQDKPKKKLESTIGKIIYGFLLFAPLLSILVTCMYVTFNKNAYQSYSANEIITNYEINYKYETNDVNSIDDIHSGNIYKFTLNEMPPDNQQYSIARVSAIYNYQYFDTINDSIISTDYLIVRIFNSLIYIQDNQYRNILSSVQLSSVSFPLSFDIVIDTLTFTDFISYENFSRSDFNIIESVTEETIESSTLDNAFEYGTYKVENSNLYNWAKNTGTYDVLHNTTQLLGIENTFIPMLMAYWLLISIIYFIYDIALMLIMVVHRKIHELQESI